MNKLKNIVVGVDFSSPARSALRKAAQLAAANAAKIHVVHVVEEEAAEQLAEHERRSLAGMRKDLMNYAMGMLNKWCREIELPDDTERRIAYGHPDEELIEQAIAAKADVLIVGVRGISNDTEGAGAQATRLVRRAPCKVLVIEDGQSKKFERAVAAIDFSPTSKLVVEQALHMAELDGCELHFVHVYSAPWEKLAYLFESHGEFRGSYADDLEDKLRRFVGDQGGAKVAFHLRNNLHHGHGIGEFCAEQNADLAIIGTRGSSSLKYRVMGSTAEYLLSERPCSVLAVRPPEE